MTILICIVLGLGLDFSHIFSQTDLTEKYSEKGNHYAQIKCKKCKKICKKIIVVDAAVTATRARIVRGAEEIKCAFTNEAIEEEQGLCSFGGCKVYCMNYLYTCM